MFSVVLFLGDSNQSRRLLSLLKKDLSHIIQVLDFKRNTSSSLLTKQNTLEVFVFTCKPAFLRSTHVWMDEGGRAEGEGDEKGKIMKLEIKASEGDGLPTAQESFTEATPPVPPDPCPEWS